MPPRSRESRLPALALVVTSAAFITWIGWNHGLRFVDVISFSRRAHELLDGRTPSDGLYPLGYPLVLALGPSLGTNVLTVARLLSGLAAVGLVLATRQRLGFAGAIWLLAQVPLLQWGTTEGTDLLAAALAISAVLLAERPVLAGLCLGAALDIRWTAAVWLPALLIATPRKSWLPALTCVAIGTLPHWLACAWCGTLLLPDQTLNLAIAAGPGAPPPAASFSAALARIPEGLGHAWPHALPGLVSRIGAGLLLLSAVIPSARSDAEGQEARRVAGALLVGGFLHVIALAAVFANPRLALPATLVALLGFGVVVHRLGRFGGLLRGAAGVVLAAAAGALLWPSLPTLRAPAPEETRIVELKKALSEGSAPLPPGPVLANSPLAHTEAGGWLVPSINLGGLYVTPRTTPAELGRIADEHQLHVLVLDPTRGRREYAGLRELFDAKEVTVAGWKRISASSWRVWIRGKPPN